MINNLRTKPAKEKMNRLPVTDWLDMTLTVLTGW